MKPMMKEQEAEGPNPQEILDQGRQLCMIGESLIATAQAMGAEDAGSDMEASDDESVDEYSPDEGEGSENEAPSMGGDPKKMAIILAIKKKLGRK